MTNVRVARTGPIDASLIQRLKGRISAPVEGREMLPSFVPFTGEPLGEVPHGTGEDVREAVDRARAAQRTWARRSIGERAQVLRRFHDLVLSRQDEVLDLVQVESGKARGHAFEEVADCAIVARYYAHHAAEHLRPRQRRAALPGLTSTREYRHPKGRRRDHFTVELPFDARCHRRASGARGWQRRGHKAGPADLLYGASRGRAAR